MQCGHEHQEEGNWLDENIIPAKCFSFLSCDNQSFTFNLKQYIFLSFLFLNFTRQNVFFQNMHIPESSCRTIYFNNEFPLSTICVALTAGRRGFAYLLKTFSLKAYFSSLPRGVRLSCPASRKAVMRIPSHSEP